MTRRPLWVVAGTTASGKSDFAVELALALEGEVVSADSVQVRRGMDIGSGKIRAEEMRGVPHHLLSARDPDEEYNVALYQKDALRVIGEIRERGRTPILCGGTGLYINAVVYLMNIEDAAPPDETLRRMLCEELKVHGAQWLHDRLRERDPDAADRIEKENTRRVLRALEIAASGKTMTEAAGDAYAARKLREEDSVLLALDGEREWLSARISARVDRMMETGFLNEVQSLLACGYDPDLPPMKTLGYRELIGYLMGEGSLDGATEAIKIHTRQYAKRQRTWFRRETRYTWLEGSQITDPRARSNAVRVLVQERGGKHE